MARSRFPLAAMIALVAFAAIASPSRAADTCRVTLRPTDPIWNRPKDTGASWNVFCLGQAQDSINNGEPYRKITIHTTVSEPLSITVASQEPLSSGFDPFLALYCSSFNPASPLVSLIAIDDDGAPGGWPNPAIPASRNILLTPNTDYVLVISSYSNVSGVGTPYGTCLITLGGHATFNQTLIGCCKADFNQNGVVSVTDIFNYLTAWFSSSSSADTNGDGAITVSDIFGFLSVWFSGCQ